jgi:hypothetical protein
MFQILIDQFFDFGDLPNRVQTSQLKFFFFADYWDQILDRYVGEMGLNCDIRPDLEKSTNRFFDIGYINRSIDRSAKNFTKYSQMQQHSGYRLVYRTLV